MFKRNEKYYALLVPYLEGGLDDVRAADLRARLAEDPALSAEAERLRQTLTSLRETSRRSPAPENAAVPADLWPRLRDRLDPAPAPRRAAPAGWVAAVGAAAAVAFAAIWLPVGQPREPARVVNAPHPSSATSVPQRMAYATKPEAVPPAVPALPAPAPPKSPAPVPTGGKPVLSRPAVSQPLPVPPLVSGHDPFAVAKAAKPTAGAKVTAPSIVFAQPTPHNHVTTLPPAVAPDKPSPTLMASNGLSSVAGDRVAGAAKLAPPRYDAPAPAALDRFSLPSPAAPAAPPPPARAATADATVPAQDGLGGLTIGAQAAPALGVRGFAARQSPAAGHGLNAYGSLRTEHAAKRSPPSQQGAPAGAAIQQQDGAVGAGQTLDAWQSALAQAVQPPLLGQDAGVQQASQALMSARESGSLDALRERLEARRAQSPRDLTTARMLAAVYDFAFSAESALHERRRLVTLDGAAGEDWFALAEAEGHAGNAPAARAAYRRALEAPGPLSGFHAQIAKARG